MNKANTRIPSGMPRSVEPQYPHPPRIPIGMPPNIHRVVFLPECKFLTGKHFHLPSKTSLTGCGYVRDFEDKQYKIYKQHNS